jgi:VCBS repeat-containing protein
MFGHHFKVPEMETSETQFFPQEERGSWSQFHLHGTGSFHFKPKHTTHSI